MIRGIYSSGTAMLTQRQKMDVIANNMANVTTNGFKQDELISRSFKDMMISKVDEASIVNKVQEVGPFNTGIHVDQVVTNFNSGSFTATSVNTDFAIEGDGFFVINTPQGERYTKDGAFKINQDGYLTTQDGFMVMGQNGAIQVGNDEFSVSKQGQIQLNNNYIDTFRIVGFDDTNALRKEGNNLYINSGSNITNSDFSVRQGVIEASNVDLISGVVDMMTVYRNYESNQKVIQILDSTLDKAVNELGRV